MKLLFTATFLASLAFGSASNSKLGKNNHASDRDNEDFEYWRNLIDTVDSMATNAPTKSPVDSPTPPPVDDPTLAPSAPPVDDPTAAPVAATLAPSAPPVDDPTAAPVATTLAPSATTLAPSATTLAPSATTLAPSATTLAPSAPTTEACKTIGTCYYNARYKISTTSIKIGMEGYVMFLSFFHSWK
jgi:hypothetical protein